MAGLARGMRPGRRRGGRTGRPMRQGRIKRCTPKGKTKGVPKPKSMSRRMPAVCHERTVRQRREDATFGCDRRPKNRRLRGHEGLRRSSVLVASESRERAILHQANLHESAAGLWPKRLQLPSQCQCAKLQNMEGFFWRRPAPRACKCMFDPTRAEREQNKRRKQSLRPYNRYRN